MLFFILHTVDVEDVSVQRLKLFVCFKRCVRAEWKDLEFTASFFKFYFLC